MDSDKRYSIPFTGLSEGSHRFNYRLDGTFFTERGNEELADSSIDIELELIKETTFLEIDFSFKGKFKTACDRCLGDLEMPLEGERQLVAKTHHGEDDEDIIPLQAQDTKVDMTKVFFETVVIALPIKRAHEQRDCDPEVIERLSDYEPGPAEGTDPRWDALKKLK